MMYNKKEGHTAFFFYVLYDKMSVVNLQICKLFNLQIG